MSQYGLIYRMEWDTADVVRSLQSVNVTSKTIRINIYDTEVLIGDSDTPEVIPLTPAFPPLTMSSVNNEEDKLTTARAKQAIIRFQTDRTAGKDITIFSDASDNRYYVEILADGLTMFLGFLLLSDMEQPFLPDPQTVELTATDHLGLLKEIPLKDDDGNAPFGKYKLGELVALCLKQTGLRLDINVINNVKHGSGVFTADAIFFAPGSGNKVRVDNIVNFFYVGLVFTVTDAGANTGPFTVTSIVANGTDWDVFVTETVSAFAATFPGPGATFTDLSSGHLYDSIYLDALTFETNIGEAEDCRSVLNKILGEDCFLTQWKGAWWILRVAEINGQLMYPARFDPDGVFDDYIDPISPQRNIGDAATICHERASTSLRLDRPGKFAKETYRYSVPRELFCNIDFSRGSVITPPDLTLASSIGTYNTQCWTLRRLFSQPITSTPYIARTFEYGYEKDRYLVITPKSTTATPFDFLESQPITVKAKDKLSVNLSWRYENDFGGGGTTVDVFRIYLKGVDGNYYYWWNSSGVLDDFFWNNSGTSEAERSIPDSFDAGATDETNWRTISIDLALLPVDGLLYLGLNQGHQVTTGGSNQNINFQGISIDFKPVINGSYERYTGQYHKVTRLGGGTGYNANRDNEVFMSDSPRKNFKGAMLYLQGGEYFLSVRFFEANLFDLGQPTQDSYNTFGFIQAYAVWNQYKNANRKFPSSLYGIFAETPTEQWPDLMNKYALTDTNPNTDNRFFMLVSLSQDWKECKWTGLLIECYNSVVGQTKVDDHEFKYLTE